MWDFLTEENKECPLPPSLDIMFGSFLSLSCCHTPSRPHTLYCDGNTKIGADMQASFNLKVTGHIASRLGQGILVS